MQAQHKDARKLENWVTRWHPAPTDSSAVYWYFTRSWWAHYEGHLYEDRLEALEELLANNVVGSEHDTKLAGVCVKQACTILVTFCRNIGSGYRPLMDRIVCALEDNPEDVSALLADLLDEQIVIELENSMRTDRRGVENMQLAHMTKLTALIVAAQEIVSDTRRGFWARVGTGTSILIFQHGYIGALPFTQRLIDTTRTP